MDEKSPRSETKMKQNLLRRGCISEEIGMELELGAEKRVSSTFSSRRIYLRCETSRVSEVKYRTAAATAIGGERRRMVALAESKKRLCVGSVVVAFGVLHKYFLK